MKWKRHYDVLFAVIVAAAMLYDNRTDLMVSIVMNLLIIRHLGDNK